MSDMSETSSSPAMRRLPLLIVAAVAIVGAFTLSDQLDFAALAAHRDTLIAWRDSHYAATVVGFIAAYALIVGFSLPGATVATLTGGFLFATFPGALYNVIAATTGAVAIFMAARWGLGEQLAARMDASTGTVKRIKEGIDTSQWEMLFLIRLVPVVPFFVANLVPALVGVPLRRYAISTFFGIIPGAVVYTSVGAGLGDVLAAGEAPDLGVIFEPHILLPILGLAALAALPLVIKAIRGRGAV
ncbi:MAG: TVP38/TMEM64 family protein [Rhodobacteraceae bacterium]|nr:TVP38/TMEM64 family protein [Paracoccaceae bacterium]